MTSALGRGRLRSLAVLAAVVAVGGPLSGQAGAASSPPAPVTNLHLSSSNGLVYVSWTASTETNQANACWAPGATPPSSPSSSGATCSGIRSNTGYDFAATNGQRYGVSVFSYDSSSQVYGDRASGTVTGVDAPPRPPVHLASINDWSDGDHQVWLRWDDNPGNADTQHYMVNWSPGFTTPPPLTDPAHTTMDKQFEVTGLAPNVMYTFALRTQDGDNRVSPPALLHAATRETGFYLVDDKHAGNQRTRSTPRSTFSDGRIAAATMLPDAHLRSVVDSRHIPSIYYSSRTTASSGWSKLTWVQHYAGLRFNPVFIDAATSGRVAVAGTGNFEAPEFNANAWFRDRVGNYWRKKQILSKHPGDSVRGVTIDGSGDEHVLMHRPGRHGGLRYFSRIHNGKWTKTRVPSTSGSDAGLLSRDPVTNKVVLVVGRRTSHGSTIRYAVLGPATTRVTSLRTWLTSGSSRTWTASSVTSDAGRITVAVQRTSTHPALDGPYVMWARGQSHHSPVRVGGTNAHDSHPVVTALQRGSVELSWRRIDDGWDASVMGVYAARWHGEPSTNNWAFTTPSQWTNSAYDFPVAAFRAADGHVYVTYRTAPSDVRE